MKASAICSHLNISQGRVLYEGPVAYTMDDLHIMRLTRAVWTDDRLVVCQGGAVVTEARTAVDYLCTETNPWLMGIILTQLVLLIALTLCWCLCGLKKAEEPTQPKESISEPVLVAELVPIYPSQ
jgi:hypothetical protein